MQNKIKELLNRLHEEGHINNNEYNMLSSLNEEVKMSKYILDKSSNNSWESFIKNKIPESKL
jgi:hypothetical protein